MNRALLQRMIFVFSGSCLLTKKQSDVLDNCRFHLDYHCFVRVQLIADLLALEKVVYQNALSLSIILDVAAVLDPPLNTFTSELKS